MIVWNQCTVQFDSCSCKRDIIVFTGGNIVSLFSGKLRDKCECIRMVHIVKKIYYKRPSGVHCQRITCLCNIMKLIRFFFKSALPQHRKVMFISSGFMCLLDLPIQMI